MGQVNICYIPAALLHLHPGMTAGEFVDKLNTIHFSCAETDYHKDWRHIEEPESHMMHHGIFSLALEILGLSSTRTCRHSHSCAQSLNLETRHSVETFLDTDPFMRVEARQAQNGNWLLPSYTVKRLVGVSFGEPQEYDGTLYCDREYLKKGALLNFPLLSPRCAWRVTRVRDVTMTDGIIETARLTIEPVEPVYETTAFPTLEHLVNEHPQYDPSTLFDWSQERGIIDAPLSFVNRWGWVREGDKYYLDDYPPSSRGYCDRSKDESHYTSIIITAEAIKAGAWGFFGYHGYEQTWRFLVDCPAAHERHQQAVFDWWMNENALQKCMTVSEHMRQRLLAGAHTPRPALDDRSALSLVFNHGLGRYFNKYGRSREAEWEEPAQPSAPLQASSTELDVDNYWDDKEMPF